MDIMLGLEVDKKTVGIREEKKKLGFGRGSVDDHRC